MLTFSWLFIEYTKQRANRDCLKWLYSLAVSLRTTEPLDKVFAVLGLSDWQSEKHLWPKDLEVDYDQSYSKVISLFQRAAAAHDGSLWHLKWAGISRARLNTANMAPCWTADLHDTDERGVVDLFGDFQADDHRPLSTGDLLNSDSPEVLNLVGLTADVISKVIPGVEKDDVINRSALRRFFLSCFNYMRSISSIDGRSVAHAIARAMCLGGAVSVSVESRDVFAKNNEEFDEALITFLTTEGVDNNGVPIVSPQNSQTFDFFEYAIVRCTGRAMLWTSKGDIGFGPATTKAGDIVSILFGSDVPFVLRPVPCDDTGNQQEDVYLLNGACYVERIMHGEAVREQIQAGLPFATFNLI